MVDVNVLINVTLLTETSLYERRMISLSTDVFSFFLFDEIGEREKKGKLQVRISKSSATGLSRII